jgi:hypothetical protein
MLIKHWLVRLHDGPRKAGSPFHRRRSSADRTLRGSNWSSNVFMRMLFPPQPHRGGPVSRDFRRFSLRQQRLA